MDKHAYLIIAHNNFGILKKLVMMLDDKRNDIYIHIDKKVKKFNFSEICVLVKESRVVFVNRIKVTWGGYSQIQCELNMLKEATKSKYLYYHLMSGTDLPIKSQDYIHDFCKKNKGKEFIHFSSSEFNINVKSRYSVYHLLQDICGSNKNLLYLIEKTLVYLQKILHVDRSKNKDVIFCGGCNWFSITDELANYILQQEDIINKMFRFSICCDEIFMQTIVYGSHFFKNVYDNKFTTSYHSCSRYVDWKRGNPYTFQIENLDELLKSDYLFARKFGESTKQEKELVDTLNSMFIK